MRKRESPTGEPHVQGGISTEMECTEFQRVDLSLCHRETGETDMVRQSAPGTGGDDLEAACSRKSVFAGVHGTGMVADGFPAVDVLLELTIQDDVRSTFLSEGDTVDQPLARIFGEDQQPIACRFSDDLHALPPFGCQLR